MNEFIYEIGKCGICGDECDHKLAIEVKELLMVMPEGGVRVHTNKLSGICNSCMARATYYFRHNVFSQTLFGGRFLTGVYIN